MERTKPQVIGTAPFKFYKGAHYIDYIDAAKYLLYGVWRYQPVLFIVFANVSPYPLKGYLKNMLKQANM